MTSKADFAGEEWARVKRAPFVAGLAISLADPGGPIEAAKESMATLRTVRDGAGSGRGELIDAIAREVAGVRTNPLSGFKPRGATAGADILDELREVNRIVSEKATPEEAEAYREWLLSAAQEAADAAKEGGFMGFKAQRVSEGEQNMLERLRGALS
jgi:broad specificity phosphatase PhoE